mmetsp:Transcript_43239/g.50740  ORF Transcript_43239/g.50740 Transcript_43239/m.50740 type:complete len:86 (+) Transcript_43239:229-486(+)
MTVGWLLSEVTREFNALLQQTGSESENQNHKLNQDEFKGKQIVCLRTVEGILAMDYYLCQLENSLAPLKEKTLLTVHFSSAKDRQ